MTYEEFPRTRQEAETLILIGDMRAVDIQIQDLAKSINGLGNTIKNKANEEMQKAGEKTIDALAGKVGQIANEIAGNAAAATAAKAKTEAARWQAGALVVGFLAGAIGSYLSVTGAHAVNLSTARDRVAEAEKHAENTISNLEKKHKEEIENLRASSGWVGTPTGILAKQFFDSGAGAIAAKCDSPVWEITETKKGKFCVPKRREIIGGDTESHGWKIP